MEKEFMRQRDLQTVMPHKDSCHGQICVTRACQKSGLVAKYIVEILATKKESNLTWAFAEMSCSTSSKTCKLSEALRSERKKSLLKTISTVMFVLFSGFVHKSSPILSNCLFNIHVAVSLSQ